MDKLDIYKVLIIAAIIVMMIIMVLMAFSIFTRVYVKRNRDKFFNSNRQLAQKCSGLGIKLLKQNARFEQYVDSLGLDELCNCSSSIVSNAERNEVKYLMKYSNIKVSVQCMEQLDFCIEYLNNLTEFQNRMNQLHKEIKILLPIMIRPFASKKILPFLVCNVDRKKINNIEEPVFCFSYVSPAGRSGRYYEIEITSSLLKKIQAEISTKLGKSGHIKTQRSAMTNDLREAIKKRDNYTCCICGNSVLNEPNLLLEVDHIIPVSKGGVTEASNLQTLCWRCNRAKSDK